MLTTSRHRSILQLQMTSPTHQHKSKQIGMICPPVDLNYTIYGWSLIWDDLNHWPINLCQNEISPSAVKTEKSTQEKHKQSMSGWIHPPNLIIDKIERFWKLPGAKAKVCSCNPRGKFYSPVERLPDRQPCARQTLDAAAPDKIVNRQWKTCISLTWIHTCLVSTEK